MTQVIQTIVPGQGRIESIPTNRRFQWRIKRSPRRSRWHWFCLDGLREEVRHHCPHPTSSSLWTLRREKQPSSVSEAASSCGLNEDLRQLQATTKSSFT